MELQYFDISPLVSESIGVFPGDVTYSRQESLSFQSGDNLELSAIKSTLHLGAHADAPSHYHREGVGIDQRPLQYYYGDCQVIHVRKPRGSRIYPEDIAHSEVRAPRILLATMSFPNPNNWNSDFNALSAALVEDLAGKGVITLGIDTPSIDPESDKVLESHKTIFKHNMAILEGLVLVDVPEGVYQLVALPLKLQHADASPVRAILVKN